MEHGNEDGKGGGSCDLEVLRVEDTTTKTLTQELEGVVLVNEERTPGSRAPKKEVIS